MKYLNTEPIKRKIFKKVREDENISNIDMINIVKNIFNECDL